MLPLRWINSSPNIIQARQRRSGGEKSMEWNLLNVVRWVVCCVVCEIIKLPLDIFCIESLSRFDLEWHLMFKVRVSALFGSFVVECDKSASWKHIWLFCSKLLSSNPCCCCYEYQNDDYYIDSSLLLFCFVVCATISMILVTFWKWFSVFGILEIDWELCFSSISLFRLFFYHYFPSSHLISSSNSPLRSSLLSPYDNNTIRNEYKKWKKKRKKKKNCQKQLNWKLFPSFNNALDSWNGFFSIPRLPSLSEQW